MASDASGLIMTPVIRLHADDGVLIARSTLLEGAEVAPGVRTSERIPAGHKVAVRAIGAGRAGAALRADHRVRDAADRARAAGACP